MTVQLGERHVLRTGIALSLTGRERLAKALNERTTGSGVPWGRVVDRATEATLEAAESVRNGATDLRTAETEATASSFVIRPYMTTGPNALVAPGEAGKTTFMRACAVSVASGVEIIPGLVPAVVGPVLILAGEDAQPVWHARSIEAICRGAGIDRASIQHPITLLPGRGRPLHRIGRSLAERAVDAAFVGIDSLQAFQLAAEQADIRGAAALFWNAVEMIDRPVLIVAHPNRDESRRWAQADGRAAGAEVHRDRARMAWRMVYEDQGEDYGLDQRRFTLHCTKSNYLRRPPPMAFATQWEPGGGDHPGMLRFVPADPIPVETGPQELGPAMRETLAAWRAGARTAAALREALELDDATARQRLSRLRRLMPELDSAQ